METTIKTQVPEFFLWIDREIYELSFYKQHVHNFCQTVYVNRGKVDYILKGRTITLHTGDFLLVPPDTMHCPSGKQEGVFVSYEMKFFITPLLRKVFNFDAEAQIVRVNPGMVRRIASLHSFMLYEWNSGAEDMQTALECQLQYLLLMLNRELTAPAERRGGRPAEKVSLARTRKRGIAYKVRDHIRQNYAGQVQFSDLARYYNISISYLSEVFKEEIRHSLSGYLNLIRIERAKELMKTSELNFTQIAEAVGYQNVYYFSRVFKETNGVTPSGYRHLLNDNRQFKGYINVQ